MKKITPIQIIVKRGNKWYKLTLLNNSYKNEEEIKSPKKSVKQLINLDEFLSNRGLGDLTNKIQELVSSKNIYIPRPPIGEITEKEWENFWFSKNNETCESCIYNCKQSCFVDLKCDSYTKKD